MRKLISSLALGASIAVLALAAPARAATQWVVIDGTDNRWWIDTDSISKDKEKGVTFFAQTMSTQPAVPPGEGVGHDYEPRVLMAINCTTGKEFYYDDEDESWKDEESEWPPAYHASVRHIVCGQ
jgi:hypothetical protein